MTPEHRSVAASTPASDPPEDLLVTEELSRRPTRAADLQAEKRAVVALAGAISDDPAAGLQRLVETALELCEPATTAGVSVLSARDRDPVFVWPAVAGRLAPQLQDFIPRGLSPCGFVLERDEPLLVREPGRHFERLASLEPPIREALLVPFHAQGWPVGTVWLTTEDEGSRFDAEDLRVISELAPLAETGHQLQEARTGLSDMRRLQEISTRLIGEGDVESLLEEILEAAMEFMDAPMGNMQLLEPESGELVLHGQRGFGDEFLERFARVDAETHTACGAALARRQRVVEDDVEGGEVCRGSAREVMLEAGARAVQSTPMTSRTGEVLGMLSTHWIEPHAPPPHRLRLLDLLARQGADLVERARAEEALREGEERYRTLFDSIEDGFCIAELLFDDAGNPVDHRFLEVNPAFGRLLGVEDAVGRTAREALPGVEEEWFQLFGRVGLTGEPVQASRASEALGAWFDVHASRVGKPEERKVAILFRDVTDQKRAEEERERLFREVQSEREHLAEIFHHAPSLMAVLRGSDHVVERVNRLYRQLVGGRQLKGRPLREALPEVEEQGFLEVLDRVRESGEPHVGTDVRLTLEKPEPGEAEEHWINFVCQPLRSADGEVVGVFLQGVDLSERKRAEDRLRRSEERLKEVNAELERRVRDRTAELERRAQQLRRLAGQLTTAEQRQRRELAHTLHDHHQQLLAAARMKVDLVAARVEDEETVPLLREAVEHLDQSIEETRTLTTELSPPGLYREGLVPTVESLAERMEQQHGLHVEVRHDRVPGTLSDDLRAFIFQSIRELTFNVVKHADSSRAWIDVHGDPDGRWLTVSVSDQGKGCDPEAILQDGGDQFGLLSIRERLHGFGGEFDLRNAPEGGCRVTLHVPIPGSRGPEADETAPTGATEWQGDGRHAPRDGGPEAAVAERTLRVLLVEDHKIIREGLVRLLEDEPGIEVAAEAPDGQLGIEAVREVQPDVVIMDVSMPRLDGIDATRIIKRHWPEVRVIGLSMNEGGHTAAMMRKAGAEAHLPKGGPAEDLVAAIRGGPEEP